MFDLERSITEWRKQMLAAGIAPVPLAELESHLREDFERQLKSGMPQPHAFKNAIEHIGAGPSLKSEFKKVGEPMSIQVLKLTGIAFTVIAGFFVLLVLKGLFHHEMGFGAKLCGLAAVATIVMSWRYGHRFLPVIRDSWVRVTIGATACITVIVGMHYFLVYFLPDSLANALETETSFTWFRILFIWVWSAIAILGGLIFGLERAAHKQEAHYV